MEKLNLKDINEDVVNDWMRKHPSLQRTNVLVEPEIGKEQELTFYIIKPSRHVRKMITKFAKKDNVSEVERILLANCVLGGDMEFTRDPDEADNPFLEEACEMCRDSLMEEITNMMVTTGNSKKVRPNQEKKKRSSQK